MTGQVPGRTGVTAVCTRSHPASRAKLSGRPAGDKRERVRPKPGEASETHEAASLRQRACPHLLSLRGR